MKKIVLFVAVFFFLMINRVYAVSCGDTIYANTVLTGNLGPCPGDGIWIGAAGITLDCKGYTINGDGNFVGDGIDNVGFNNVVIKNCTITNFYDGIYLNITSGDNITNNTVNFNNDAGIVLNSASSNINVANNTADSNTNTNNIAYGIWLSGSSNNRLTYNTVNSNNYGIFLNILANNNNITHNAVNSNGVGGIYLQNSSNNNIISNAAYSNGDGIELWNFSNNNTLTGNIANSNGNGVGLFSSSSNTLTSNTVNSNSGDGIRLDFSSTNNTLTSNTANSNVFRGVGIFSSNYNVIQNNTFNSNRNRYGIVVSNSNYTIIKNNTANLNEIGIFISQGFYNQIINNNASINTMLPFCGFGIHLSLAGNNTLINNTANANCAYGIYFSGGADNNTLINNTFNSNIEGIFISGGSSNVLSNNTAMNNNDSDFSSGYMGTYGSGPNSLNNLIKNLKTQQNLVSFTYKTDGLYNYVTLKGLTVAQAPQDPTNYSNISKYVNATGNSSNSWLYLNVSYADSDIPPGISESTLRIWKYNSSGWTIADGSGVNGVDTVNNVVYANITNFGSTFAPLVRTVSTPPSITILSPQNITYYTTSIPLTFTVSEPASWCGYSLDGNANVTLASCANTTLTGLGYNSHSVIVYANDTSGNMDFSNRAYFTVFAPVCGDNIWQDGEWCGHDCYNTTGSTDMNHDCVVDTLDNILMLKLLGRRNTSGDFTGDGKVDITDIVIFVSHYGDFITNCIDARQYFIDKKGSLSISFNNDTSNIINSANVSVNSTLYAYIIADDVQNLTSMEFGLSSSPNLNFSGFSTSPNINFIIGNENRIEIALQSWQQPVSGPVVIGWATYNVIGTGSGNISIIKDSHFGELEWSKPPEELYRSDFANIFNATITSFMVPNITILSPKDNTSYYKLNVLLNFTIDKPTSWIGYSLNNTFNKTMSGPVNLTNLTNGWNNITVFANDTSGIMGSSFVKFFYCLGDVSGPTPGVPDGRVDVSDTAFVSKKFGASCGNPKPSMPTYDARVDMNDDCKVDITDVAIVSKQFGKTCK